MHDVAGEIACVEGCAETISVNVLKSDLSFENLLFGPVTLLCNITISDLLFY